MPGRTKPLLISPSIPTVAPCVLHHTDVTHEAIRVRPRGRIHAYRAESAGHTSHGLAARVPETPRPFDRGAPSHPNTRQQCVDKHAEQPRHNTRDKRLDTKVPVALLPKPSPMPIRASTPRMLHTFDLMQQQPKETPVLTIVQRDHHATGGGPRLPKRSSKLAGRRM